MKGNGFDIVILGAGHAGVEAALACARMGFSTLCLALNLDAVALMACNPSVGGTSKGHLVREIDALGGEMGLAADDAYIQVRMLNTGKGPAVQSLRAQIDKRLYHERMKRALEGQENLLLLQGECARIETQNGRVRGIRLSGGLNSAGESIPCRAVVVATGVYMKSRVLIGDRAWESGPAGLMRAEELSLSLRDLGFNLRRFKTGTPARVSGRSLDYASMELQPGDEPQPHFSFLTGDLTREQTPCYLTYTNGATHDVIRANLHRSAMYSGLIRATGTRYCPSIEDKITRFADKERHQIFIEPEGLSTDEKYVQGMSTSLPADVQREMLRTIPGLENCRVTRYGYAIEYDCIDPLSLDAALRARGIEGLYFAGQINGSSGYEEAAAQGLYAGINAALALRGEPPLILSRADAYIGVLCDDLTGKGTNEPYRMMTSRAEYRLLLRQDNADERLTGLARRTGLVSHARYARLMRKREEIARAKAALNASVAPGEALAKLLESRGEAVPRSGARLGDLLRRRGVAYTDLLALYPQALPALSPEAREAVELDARYAGYIEKEKALLARFRALEDTPLPPSLDYSGMDGLRIEARQKLAAAKPESLGRASRIPGVSPADVAVLMIYLKKQAAEDGREGN
ncbi:MAG: tRNA uridine 5-carboxymethylaminomethyl modification enzyme MnmG [Firmicutes bacterium ADurb.Bin248]|nr:MAG: tRNA uridine 5-carboxymethylaminomethyl modification enzyme MnmG [Firmicutes bacterium ADurb.Bin248]